MKSRKADALLFAVGSMDLAGRRAQSVPAAGYSRLELERAGLTLEQGREVGIPIDTERMSGVGVMCCACGS